MPTSYKLTAEQRDAIRVEFARGGVTKAELARRHGVKPQTVGSLLKTGSKRLLAADIRAARDERDAAIACAVHGGRSTMGLGDAEAIACIGRSLAAWLKPEVASTRAGLARDVRRAAGLEVGR